MSMALVNGRVDVRVKKQAEGVLAAHATTPSEAIRGLYQHIAETRQLPDFLAPDPRTEQADRQRRLAVLQSVAGISHSHLLVSDADTARLLVEELESRHA
jgi:DNA-damage-inducible protein J